MNWRVLCLVDPSSLDVSCTDDEQSEAKGKQYKKAYPRLDYTSIMSQLGEKSAFPRKGTRYLCVEDSRHLNGKPQMG